MSELQDDLKSDRRHTPAHRCRHQRVRARRGLGVALGADWRIASEHAQLGLPEVTLGLIPGGGGTPRLARLIGISRAKELLMTRRQVSAADALPIGLVDEVPAGEAHSSVVEWASRFTHSAPLAVAASPIAWPMPS
ncbi:enoyl-CoA hydratase/isomerase family protein [Haloechinothrix salitolerans]|uniref:Enoyl-CoA hydratase/isomerase family protein n=1 Tax=Haloechinothrix salitolerans TaxID=926830 RepID=A0ABW2C506_9PSEU